MYMFLGRRPTTLGHAEIKLISRFFAGFILLVLLRIESRCGSVYQILAQRGRKVWPLIEAKEYRLTTTYSALEEQQACAIALHDIFVELKESPVDGPIAYYARQLFCSRDCSGAVVCERIEQGRFLVRLEIS